LVLLWLISVVACGGGSDTSTGPATIASNGSLETAVTVSGLVWNSPLDGVTVTATCADATFGGSAKATRGSYSITVSCKAANFPIVLATTSDGMLAGADLQFGTADDSRFRLAERSPLKIVIGTRNMVNANITAVSTLAAQPIEDRIFARKASPGTASKPTLADVQNAERNAAVALGLGSTDIRSANPLTNPQIARISAQLLEAIAVARSFGPPGTSAEDVMKSLSQAAQYGGIGGTGTAGNLFKTETDGMNSFDIQATKTALKVAAAAIAKQTPGSTAAQMTTVIGALTDAQVAEPAIKEIGTNAEQVVRAISGLVSVQTFDASRDNVGAIAKGIEADLSSPSSIAANTSPVMATISSEAMRVAGLKVQEIDGSTAISTSEVAIRKRAVFMAAEAIRSAQQHDIIVKSANGALSQDDVARAVAQVCLAVNVTGDLLKTVAITDIMAGTTNALSPNVAGLAAKVRNDIGVQISARSRMDLGDLKSLDAQKSLGAPQVVAIKERATGALTLLNNFDPVSGASDLAVRASVTAVVESISVSTNFLTVKPAVQNTVRSLATSLTNAMTQLVTVGPSANVALSTLPSDLQTRVLTLAAHSLIGLAKLDYSSAPSISTAASAITTAAATVSKTLAATKTQLVTFGPLPSLVVGGVVNLVATGGATGNSITFSTTTPQVCSVVGKAAKGVSVGVCVVAANQAGNATYLASSPVTQQINVTQGSQVIAFGTAPKLTVGGTGSLSATGGASGNPIVFSSTTTAVCTVAGNIATGISLGSCIVAANQAGNANYSAAAEVTQTITVAKASQTITFGAPPLLKVGDSGSVNATGGASGKPVTFSSTTPGICIMSGNTVTGVSAGVCAIAADQAGNTIYKPADQAIQTFVIGQIPQVIVFGAAPSVIVGGTATLAATGGASGNPVVFGATTPATCGIVGVIVTGVGAGTCIVTANQAGNTNFAAATQVTQNIIVAKATQTITFGTVPTIIAGATGTVTATGGASGNQVTFSSTTQSVCTVSGSIVTGVTAGTCVIAANQPGSANYLAAPQATQQITIGPGVGPFAGICQVQLASAIGYVTGVASASSCISSILDVDGFGATASVGPASVVAGRTAVDFAALADCDPLGAPPTPGATTLTPCKR
jgi:hypothetical protein